MLLLLELNEVNLEYVQFYARQGMLPNFKRLLDRHGCARTSSESKYEELEPWIQWVTAHTGQMLAEHGVRHLGDIVHTDIEQIWETLAKRGLRVGAISPMNGKCRDKGLAFFIPDPWTKTEVIGTPIAKRLYSAICQVVNDNAQARVTLESLFNLAVGAAWTVPLRHYPRYLRLAGSVMPRPWIKSVILDQLLADLFVKSVKKHRVDFATLFLNAAAHIQHHYLFSSTAYQGAMRNPPQYVPSGMDPVLDVYAAYDVILGDVLRSFPAARVMLATGLHQDPHPAVTYYWRLRDHAGYLRKIGVAFASVEPRMSRDFLINFADQASALRAKSVLETAIGEDQQRLFSVEDQGDSLFVMLTYEHEISPSFRYTVGNRTHDNLDQDVVFVALKNGQHNGTGYFVDTQAPAALTGVQFPLAELPARILEASLAA